MIEYSKFGYSKNACFNSGNVIIFLKYSTVNVTINKEDIRMYIYKQIKLTSAIQMWVGIVI